MKDIALNPIFASVAADLGHVPGDHYGLADVAPYATPIPAAEITADTAHATARAGSSRPRRKPSHEHAS